MFSIASGRTVMAAGPLVRPFSTSMVRSAAAVKPTKKKKVQFKPGAVAAGERTKPKKGGMTHLEFKDAVGSMKYHKNAPALESLDVQKLSFSELESLQNTIIRYSSKNFKSLRSMGGFDKLQHHELFKKPVSLVNENTVNFAKNFISKIANTASKDNRICLVGENGVGKSTVMTQAQVLALNAQPVILLHIADAGKIVNGSSDYLYNPKLKLYQQPMLTKKWFSKIRSLNKETLKTMPLTRDISFSHNRETFNLKKDENNLFDYLEQNHDFGKFTPTNAFQFFIEELQAHSERVSVIVSVDNFNAMVDFPVTKYKTSDFLPIHVSQFEIGSFLLKVAGGELSFAKGGVLLAKTGDVGTHRRTLDVALGLREYDPYYNSHFFDVEIANKLRSNGPIEAFVVKNWTKDETRAMLRFYQKAGVLFVEPYKTKQAHKSSKELLEEKLVAKAEVTEIDPEEQFETIVQNHYSISGGNPSFLLRATSFTY